MPLLREGSTEIQLPVYIGSMNRREALGAVVGTTILGVTSEAPAEVKKLPWSRCEVVTACNEGMADRIRSSVEKSMAKGWKPVWTESIEAYFESHVDGVAVSWLSEEPVKIDARQLIVEGRWDLIERAKALRGVHKMSRWDRLSCMTDKPEWLRVCFVFEGEPTLRRSAGQNSSSTAK
jgi:hypothetical protein